MSFNVTPKDAPASAQAPQSWDGGAKDAKARAIAALMGHQAGQQPAPVQNANNVTPEEMSVVKSSSETHANEDASASPADKTPDSPVSEEATKAKEEPLSAQYAQLARKEKALRAEMQRLKAEREAFKREQEQTAKAKEPAQPSIDQSQFIPKERLLKDTLAVLEENGLTYDQLTQMAMNAPSPEQLSLQRTVSKLEAKIAELEDKSAKTQQTFEERDKQSYQQAVNQIRNEVKQLVTVDTNYEMIKATNSVDDVVELIEKTWKEEGRLMSHDEAATAVEDYLVEESLKLSKLSKIQKRLQPSPAAPKQQASETAPAPKQPQAKTLSNSVTSQRPLTAKERAMLAFKGELKS